MVVKRSPSNQVIGTMTNTTPRYTGLDPRRPVCAITVNIRGGTTSRSGEMPCRNPFACEPGADH
jgi:hypothetical protein